MVKKYDLIIIGSGAAGLSVAFYAGRYTLNITACAEDAIGATTTYLQIKRGI